MSTQPLGDRTRLGDDGGEARAGHLLTHDGDVVGDGDAGMRRAQGRAGGGA